METIGPAELLIILVVVLVLFGSRKLPELARSMGQAATEFRRGLRSESVSSTTPPAAEETVTLTRAQLDTMIAEHELKGRSLPSPSTPLDTPGAR